MKRAFILFFLVIVFSAFAQHVRENSERPPNENHGRVLHLTEILRIGGEGEDYYFIGANGLQTDRAGNIYIRDVWTSRQRAHLPVFSPEGRFLRDLYRQGEGPGEIASSYDFALSGSEIYVYDYSKKKIMVMDGEGSLIREFKFESESVGDLIGLYEDWLVFMRKNNPHERKTSSLYDVENVIVFVSKDGRKEENFHVFIHQQFFISLAQGGGSMNWDPFICILGDGKLFVNATQEYLVEVLDLKSGEIAARFNRKYDRVRYEPTEWEQKFISQHNAPKKRFVPDIEALYYNRGQLWVQTSREEEGRGRLFDVFDLEGKYLDSFYVPIKGRILKIDGDILYTAEEDEDFLPSVVKYRID